MIRAAELAGERLKRDFSRPDLLEVREKSASDFVSSADLASQEILKRELAAAFPDHAILAEEDGLHEIAPGTPRFYVDPLDGTTNFVHGIPHFAVAIAEEVAGEVVAGVVLSPAAGELFWAEKGGGAFVGDRRLRVSREQQLSRAVIGTGIPHHGGRHHAQYLRALDGFMREVAGVRRLGAAALDLAWVAAGRFEAFFEIGLKPWDVAAGTLFVREAGGVVTRIGGGPTGLADGDILATAGGALHGAMSERLGPLHGVASARS